MTASKHPCADCLCCQWCSDERCRLCRGVPPRGQGRSGLRAKTIRSRRGGKKP